MPFIRRAKAKKEKGRVVVVDRGDERDSPVDPNVEKSSHFGSCFPLFSPTFLYTHSSNTRPLSHPAPSLPVRSLDIPSNDDVHEHATAALAEVFMPEDPPTSPNRFRRMFGDSVLCCMF